MRCTPMLLVACVACSAGDPSTLVEIDPVPELAPTVAGLASDRAIPPAGSGRLPAGLSFRHVYGSCPECVTPQAAVIRGIVATPSEAERTLVRMGTDLGGYPFAAHTDELGLEDEPARGIAIVTGLYPTIGEAREAVAEGEVSGDAFELAPDHTVARGASQLQVLAMGRRTTAAYPTLDSDEPSCFVPARRLFLVSSDVLAQPPAMSEGPTRLPITCGDAIAYVDITDTRYFATVVTDERGPRLRQSVEVACDTATIRQWPLQHGRRVGDGVELQSCQ